MNKEISTDYNALQKNIDKVIGKIGLFRTIHLLESFLSNTATNKSERDKTKTITHYLVDVAVKAFDLKEEFFYVSNVREYKDARRCCFYLLRKYTEETFPKIGVAFQCSERTVSYGYVRAAEYLAAPQGNARFVSRYTQVESALLEFIGKLN